MDWQDKVIEMYEVDKDWDKITTEMMPWFPGKTFLQVYEIVRKVPAKVKKRTVETIKEDCIVGVISDLHIPFEHPNYLQFCIDTFKKYKVKKVVQVGDLFDQYAFSRYIKNPNSYGAKQELDLARGRIAPWFAAFPELDLVESNHDKRYILRAEEAGLPEEMIVPFQKVFGLPKRWRLHDEFVLNNVIYKHGDGCSGANGARDSAIREQLSTVIGHIHTHAGCQYVASKRNLIFGLNVGCGIDIAALAFAYNKHQKERPILACGIVYDSNHADVVPMGLEYFRG